jgi:hypothetical protein
LGRINQTIDDDDTIIDKTAVKKSFAHSMNAFLRHGFRTINSVTSKTVHKIGSHFDSLNFSENLPRFATYGRKTKGYAFSFTASLYNIFDGNNAALIAPGANRLGVDPLLCEIMKTPTTEQHMSDIIEYTLIKKSSYVDSPASYDALQKYLQKKRQLSNNDGQGKKSKTATAPMEITTASALVVNTDMESNSSSVRSNNSANSPTGENIRHRSSAFLFGADPTSPLSQSSLHEYPDSNNTSGFSGALSVSFSDEVRKETNASHALHHINDDDTSSPFVRNTTPSERMSNAALATTAMRKFVQVLLSDVKHNSNDELFLKLNTKHNMRVTRNLGLMKFIEMNESLDDTELYELFCASPYFKSLSCAMFVPFQLRDQYNIQGDGYCFYRALFMLYLREQGDYILTADQLRELDHSLKDITLEGTKLREQFQLFFARLESLFPDKHAKSKAATAGCTFSHLLTYLDQRFWGGSDSVPFLDFVCTAFSYNRGEHADLSGCWAKMFCSSIFGIVNGVETLSYDTVGDAYSLHDVLMVLMRPHNWLIHKQVHFFVGDHPTVDRFLYSFACCMSGMLTELRTRVVAAKGEGSTMSFTEVYDRLDQGVSTVEDIEWLNETRCTLERQLTEKNFAFADTEAPPSPPATPTVSNKKEAFLATPFGATQEQKIYISTINNTVNRPVHLFYLRT